MYSCSAVVVILKLVDRVSDTSGLELWKDESTGLDWAGFWIWNLGASGG